MLPTQERHLESRNRQRCSNYHCFEDIFTDDSRVVPNYNSLPYINMSGGTTSPSTSGSTSRRHSGGGAIRKCDNITKYPDKKHIEDKLNQIREYLKVTSSLMSSVKEDQSNANEHDELLQMLTALRDSEKKLETLLVDKEAAEQHFRRETAAAVAQIESPQNGVPTLDTDPAFQTFQNNVSSSSERNELEQKMEINEKKLHALHEHQNLLMRLQEKAENQLKDARKAQERLAAAANVQYDQETKNSEKNRSYERSQSAEIEMHPDQLGLLQSTNEGRGQLLRLLDARDNELCSEQHALQEKMQELNSKKQHIDQLVSQLHSYGQECEEGDDMANQIRQIVAMKEQLATLKDMLSAVKSTEAQLLHQNSVERSEGSDHIPVVKSGNMTKSSSVGLSDSESDRRWPPMGKQSNKSSISSSREQLQLHAELQAKKQELEELMYKDQDRTSAINQDVCSELVMNKAEQSFSVESVPSSWTLLQDSTPPRETCVSRQNVYSSDEEELENYPQSNNFDFAKQLPNRRHVLNCNPIVQETASTPSITQNLNPQWAGDHKQQLELMTNLCQSLLEQQRQIMPNQCNPMNVQWYSSYMQMQQALMLSTISQCCQLLWQQQQDINSLISTVSMMQRPKPTSSTQQQHNLSPPTNETVGSACSLPTRLPSNNTEYASPPLNLSRNIPSAPVSVMPQSHQPVWQGVQALNNQVAPGNRANNYWDNFRSYSRQNLLSTSTKSNEGSQNSLPMFDRSPHQPLSQQRSQSHTLPKINIPIQESVVVGERTSNRTERSKPAKRNRATCRNRNEWNEETPQSENSPQKSKLFEVLRENVYKEVTLLISANENRPHFLIQLFRDLQLISSDPLRRSALHSIQSLISRSLNEAPPANVSVQCPSGLEQCAENPIGVPPPQVASPFRNKPGPSRCCAQSTTMENIKLDLSAQRILMDLLSFLRSHNEDIFNSNLIDVVKKMILEQCNKPTGCNNKLQAKLDLLLNEYLSKYKGKRVMDIKEYLLKTIADVLLDEILAIETVNEPKQPKPIGQEVHQIPKPIENNIPLFLGEHNYTLPLDTFQFLQLDHQKARPNFSNVPRVDNGDLAEADQSRRDAENEEGAVGGLLANHVNAATANNETNVASANNELPPDLDMFINPDLNN